MLTLDRMGTARHGMWTIFAYWYEWAYQPAVVDDFGTLVIIDARRTAYSLSLAGVRHV